MLTMLLRIEVLIYLLVHSSGSILTLSTVVART